MLNKLDELLQRNQVTPELEKATGMSREEMEQFVKKYKNVQKDPVKGPGREITIKPGETQKFDPNRTLPDLNPTAKIGSRTDRSSRQIATDQVRDNIEGARFEIPRELQPGFQAFKSSISRSRPRTSTPNGDGGSER